MKMMTVPKKANTNGLMKIAVDISKNTNSKDEDRLKAIGVITELTEQEKEKYDYGIPEIKKKAIDRLF